MYVKTGNISFSMALPSHCIVKNMFIHLFMNDKGTTMITVCRPGCCCDDTLKRRVRGYHGTSTGQC